MKTAGKVAIACSVIFFLCAVSGIVLTVVGCTQIANDAEFWNNISEKAEGFIDELGISEVTFDIGNTAYVKFEEKNVVENSIEKIVIKGIVYDVNICTTQGEEIVAAFSGDLSEKLIQKYNLTAQGGDTPIDFKIVGNEMTVEFAKTTVSIGGSYASKGDVTIYIPESFAGEVELEVCMGDVDIVGLNVSGFCAKGCLGDVDFEGQLKSFSVQDCLGDIDIITGSSLNGTSRIENNLGDIEITLAAGDRINIETEGNLGEITTEDVRAGSTASSDLLIKNNLGDVEIQKAR